MQVKLKKTQEIDSSKIVNKCFINTELNPSYTEITVHDQNTNLNIPSEIKALIAQVSLMAKTNSKMKVTVYPPDTFKEIDSSSCASRIFLPIGSGEEFTISPPKGTINAECKVQCLNKQAFTQINMSSMCTKVSIDPNKAYFMYRRAKNFRPERKNRSGYHLFVFEY